MKTFRPTFNREWRVFNGTRRSQAAEMTIAPGDAEGGPGNRHAADQWMFVIAGRGRARVKGKTVPLGPGKLLLIEAGETHEVRCVGREPLRTLNVYAPPAYGRKKR